MTHRRHFIKVASTTALGLSFASGVLAAGSRRNRTADRIAPQTGLHCARFAKLVGTVFYLTEASGTVSTLTLVAAEDVGSRFALQNADAGVQLESFTLLFRARPDRMLEQGTYEFQHPRIGTFPLFISPKPGDGKHAYYEAVFNRIS